MATNLVMQLFYGTYNLEWCNNKYGSNCYLN